MPINLAYQLHFLSGLIKKLQLVCNFFARFMRVYASDVIKVKVKAVVATINIGMFFFKMSEFFSTSNFAVRRKLLLCNWLIQQYVTLHNPLFLYFPSQVWGPNTLRDRKTKLKTEFYRKHLITTQTRLNIANELSQTSYTTFKRHN